MKNRINTIQKLKIDSKDCLFAKYNNNSYIVSHDTKKIVVVEENSRKYTLNNDIQKELVVYRIDGGIINSTHVDKCDFGIYSEDGVFILIELKGSDYDHACDQIISTITQLDLTQLAKSIFGRIVLSRGKTPNLRSTSDTKLKNILKKYKGNLKSSSLAFREKLSSL